MRARLSYANVMATIAVFIALGGSSYAAVKITGAGVQDESLTGRDIRRGSLTSSDVRDRSLLARDFKAGQLPAGRMGATGAQGATGTQGATGATGATGELGPKGDTGSQGPKGDKGDTGAAGSNATINGVAASGALTGTYPAPGLAAGAVTPDALGTLPYGQAIATAGQSIEHSLLVRVQLHALESAGGGFTFNNATDELTVPRAGTYVLSASLLWSPNTAGTRSLSVARNGSTLRAEDSQNAFTNGATTNHVAAVRRLAAGDTLSLSASQSSGAPLSTLPVGGNAAILTAAWIGP